jgi:hypothetical protein
MPETPSFREIGVSGLKRSRGLVQEEFLRELQGIKAVKVFREMADNDATVGATLFIVEMTVRQARWSIRPYSDDESDVENAEFVESCLHDMSHTWDEFLSECLTFLQYGWSYFEEVYKLRLGPEEESARFRSQHSDGRVGWRKFGIRAQSTLERWEFDDAGGIQGMWQNPTEFGKSLVFIPIKKALLFRTQSTMNNPEGKSILRNAYRAWYLKKRIEEIEGIGIERDLAGLPFALVPPEILDDDADDVATAIKQEMLELVSNVKRDEQEGILLPAVYDESGNPLYDFKLLSTGGRRQFDTDMIISRWDHRISMSVLADFILLGHKNVGSFAMSRSKVHLFSVAMDAFLDMISDVFNRHAIPRLFRFNDLPMDRLPNLVHGTVEEPDLETLAEYIKSLTTAQIVLSDNDTQNYLRSIANLPEISADTVAEIRDLNQDPESQNALVGGEPAERSEELDGGAEA